MSDGPSVPLWARWRIPASTVVPWARITLDAKHGPESALLLSCSRGWVSVRVERASGPVGEIWPPELVRWDDAVLLPECSGVEVKAADGRVFRVGADEVDRVWAGVRWALENGAVVEGLRNI